MTKKIIAFAAAAAMAFLTSFTAFAEQKDAATAIIPVEYQADEDSVGSFVLNQTGEPSPYATTRTYEMELPGGGKGEFEADFTVPGTYRYEIYQKKGDEEGVTYDDSVYAVDVYVTETDDGVMTAEAVAWKEGSKEKTTSCSFVSRKGSGAKDELPDVKGDAGSDKETEKPSATPSGSVATPSGSVGTPSSSIATPSGSSDYSSLKGDGPKTGDESPIARYAALLSVSTATIVVLLAILARRREDEEEFD